MGKGGEAGAISAPLEGRLLKKFTWDEISRHRTPKDAWMVYRNKVRSAPHSVSLLRWALGMLASP
eukprot:scaffold1596_cov302-Pinguiococcus_pyrenoidosus.AAC.71